MRPQASEPCVSSLKCVYPCPYVRRPSGKQGPEPHGVKRKRGASGGKKSKGGGSDDDGDDEDPSPSG